MFGGIVLLLTLVHLATGDPVLHVVLRDIHEQNIIFEVSGPDSFHNLPIKSIGVNYTEIKYNDSNVSLEEHHAYFKFHSMEFDQVINVTGLEPGSNYKFQFYAINTQDERGLYSDEIYAILLPETPDFSISHDSGTVSLSWNYPKGKYVDYFLLSVEKV